MRKLPLVASALACLAAAGTGADERPGAAANRAQARVVPATPQLFGTVTYDTGVNVGFYPDDPMAGLNRIVGNRFDSALGEPLLMTGMLSFLTVFPANGGAQSVSVLAPPNSIASAMVLRFVTAPMVAGAFNQITFTPPVPVGPDFIGSFLGRFGTFHALGLLGMSDMQTMGQGYHAVQGFYFAQMATMIEPVPGRNAMLRATGDILMPVELIHFTVQ